MASRRVKQSRAKPVKLDDLVVKEQANEGFLQKLKPYKDIIDNLTSIYRIETQHLVVSVLFSHDCSRIICVLKVCDEHYIVQ